jgi:hypothetical protein
METELIIFHRPFNSIIASPNEPALDLATGSNYVYTLKNNINTYYTKNFQSTTRPNSGGSGGLNIDLYDNVSVPLNYTILDVREPEKRKTNWSKTIIIPGTKNNNRIFSHIYEIGVDGWITIGGTSVYEGFNPNLRLECILLSRGVQVLKGNLQLKKISKDVNGNIEYEISLSGDLTSLFFDIGTAKVSDLDFSEWNHDWTKDNIEKSWDGISSRNSQNYDTIINGSNKSINKIYQQSSSGRLAFKTTTSHGLLEEDWVRILPDTNINERFYSIKGEWQVVDVISSTEFAVNYFYPVSLSSSGITAASASNLGTINKRTSTGKGYVYPMISWGDEYDYNSFPVTSFVPGIYVKEVWDKIFEETKSSYQSDFLNSQFFKRLILIQKKSAYTLDDEDFKSRKFWVGTTQSYLSGASFLGGGQWVYTQVGSTSSATAAVFPSLTAKNFPFKSESGGFGTVSFYDNALVEGQNTYGNWDNGTYKWKVSSTGEYDLTAVFRLSGWADMAGFGTNPGSGTAGMTPSTYRYYPGSGGQYYNNAYDSGPGPFASEDPYCFGMQIKATIKRLRDGIVQDIGSSFINMKMNNQNYWTPDSENWEYFGRYRPVSWQNRQLVVTSNSKYFKQNDEVWIELQHNVQAYGNAPTALSATGRKIPFAFNQSGGQEIARGILADFYLKVDSFCNTFNDPSNRTVEGGKFDMSNVVPKDMEAKDLLLAVIKMFNLHIEQDKQVDRKYYIEPRDTFYKDGSSSSDFIDWSEKLDVNSVEMIPLGELIAKYYVFENKEENDYWNKRFKDDRGRGYSYYKKEINNDFLKNETKLSIPLGTTPMINNPAGSDVVMPAILQMETNGSMKPVSNSLPRILIWGGLRPYTMFRGGATIDLSNAALPYDFGWEMLSGSQSTEIFASNSTYKQYPYAGTVDSPADPIRDINWYNMESGDFVYYDNARWTNENLYNKYWSNFINEVSDPTSKVIVANILLTPADIFKLDFRKIYILDGHYVRLQKIIDYDPTGDGWTKCEFLKLKSPVKFSRRSIIVDSYGTVNNTFVNQTDTTRPVSVNDLQVAPSRKKPEFGYNNTTAGVNLSNSVTIVTTGFSNYVGQFSKNISITGNENSIGDGSENIQISGGSGNLVVGGVKNVNIIGTNKKLITESNVTYINGIRYVNGLPISRSNVIDGGQDITGRKQSLSTTPNVVDAVEDYVIQSGSSVFENVINSGEDSILPDLPVLGISTQLNPNPRTNLSYGYETSISSTQSYADVIRKRSENR